MAANRFQRAGKGNQPRNESPQPSSQLNPERRIIASRAKYDTQDKRGNKGTAFPALAPTSLGTARSVSPQQQYSWETTQQQPPNAQQVTSQHAGGTFDETISSGFDMTTSFDDAENFEPNHAHKQQTKQHGEEEEFDDDEMTEHGNSQDHLDTPFGSNEIGSRPSLDYRRSPERFIHDKLQFPAAANEHSISGRFEAGKGQPGSEPHITNGIKKRGRSTGSQHHIDDPRQFAQSGDGRLSRTQGPTSHNFQKPSIDQTAFEESSDPESDTVSNGHGPRDDEVVRLGSVGPEVNYISEFDDNVLRTMTYQELKDQTWEKEYPGKQGAGTLEERIQRMMSKKFIGPDGEKNHEATRDHETAFFKQLSHAEWEKVGDVFLNRMAEVLNAQREARKNWRAVMAKFELEIEQRECSVRSKLDGIQASRKTMHQGAESVLKGKKF